MHRAPLLCCVSGLVVALSGLLACTSKRIRLGDGPVRVEISLDSGAGGSGGARALAAETPGSNGGQGSSVVSRVDSGMSQDSAVSPEPDPAGGLALSADSGSPPVGTASAVSPEGGVGGGSALAVQDSGQVCLPSHLAGDEVLWIGDGWFTMPGTQLSRVEDYARSIGALGMAEHYATSAMSGAGIDAIVAQYQSGQSQVPPPRVLIMDGGTWDTIFAPQLDVTVSQVVSAFQGLLSDIASNGSVDHIIYVLMPEVPAIIGVAELRPGLKAACDASAVPCYFLDLQEVWAAGETNGDYTNGYLPSDKGADAIADSVWALMQENCIAQ